ncbi:MAG: tetratricopeptide repeat protein [Lysobacteraceae bacterium]
MNTHQVRAVRLRSFLAHDPGNTDLACDLADALFADGDYADAQTVLTSIPGDGASVPGVRFRLARYALTTGDYAHAADEYAAMIAAGHDGIAVRHDLAFAQLCLRQADDAMRTLESAIADFGATPELLILRSRVEAMLEQYPQAAASADAALALRPDDALALGVKSLALLDDNQLDAAAQTARDALQIDPDQHEALLVASTLCLWQQDLEPARDFFERALGRHPNSGRALSGYGQLLMLRNELPRAGEVLDHATRAMPNHIGTWHALAWNQLLRGEREAAEASYRSAYDVDRNFGDTHGGLALVAALRGDYEEAEQSIKRALRLDPDAVTARYAQALLMEARGDVDGSEAAIARLLPTTGAFAALPVREFAQRLKDTLKSGSR